MQNVIYFQVLLAKMTGSQQYRSATQAFCDARVSQSKSPKGLIFISPWGSLRYAANIAYICLQVRFFIWIKIFKCFINHLFTRRPIWICQTHWHIANSLKNKYTTHLEILEEALSVDLEPILPLVRTIVRGTLSFHSNFNSGRKA